MNYQELLEKSRKVMDSKGPRGIVEVAMPGKLSSYSRRLCAGGPYGVPVRAKKSTGEVITHFLAKDMVEFLESIRV